MKSAVILGNIHNIDNIKFKETNFYLVLENIFADEYFNYNDIYLDKADIGKRVKTRILKDDVVINLEKRYSLKEFFDGMVFQCPKELSSIVEESDKNQIVPLFYIQADEKSIQIYSQLRFYDEEMIFIKTGEIAKDETITYQDVIQVAKKVHAENNVFLGNHQCYYEKEEFAKEIEYKFNILDNADPWVLINELIDDVKNRRIADYIFEYRDDFQKWDYMNYMFKVYGDETQKGYISFLPLTNGKYTIKRKIYGQDQLTRTEIHYKNVEIDKPFKEYLEERFQVACKEFPPFRRIRYDINIECTKTGNVHGIFFDYITVDGKNQVLKQCEIEYLRTRSLYHNKAYCEELEFLQKNMVEFFKKRNIKFKETFYSKLSFMEEVCR